MSGTATTTAAAREELMLCEQEIQSIKSALRRIGTSNDGEQQNCMEIVLLKVCVYLCVYHEDDTYNDNEWKGGVRGLSQKKSTKKNFPLPPRKSIIVIVISSLSSHNMIFIFVDFDFRI
jgi:hypothetical protein